MTRAIRDALAAQFDEYSVGRQLHDVPPHEVYEVRVAERSEATSRANGRRAVCKRDTGPTGTAGIEGRVTAFVGEHTSVPVPSVLAVGEDYYVAAWHPDAPAPDAGHNVGEAWARAAGRGLATLHAETAPLLDEYGRFERDGSGLAVAGHDDWHEAAMAYVRERRPLLADHGHADVADAVLGFLREHPGVLSGTGDPVCCHGWWTPEHVAVRDGEVACVVDLEHALAAPSEWDFWRAALPAFDGDGLRRAFRDGYESVRSLPPGFEERRPVYVALNGVYYFESLFVQDQHGAAATRERAAWLRESVFETLDDLD